MNQNAYIDKAEAELAQWKAKLEEFTAKAREKTADLRIGHARNVKTLTSQHTGLSRQLVKLRGAGGDNWLVAKKKFDLSLARLRKGINDIGRAYAP